ncbi:MAG: hypothetical protein KatS3mg003_1574 [Candidatus Nitrosocaldaceae archaeon]|nr:MAG: hypothetical protein KatS3mg003_1574 [Candidatus Nitrosocaldaceae archaeon]
MIDYKQKIREIKSFNDAFELARRAVEEQTGMRRVGLTLLLQDMPGYIGAYHVVGSNYIVVNRTVLNAIKELAKSDEEYNSYLFVVIMHEYLHSLGLTDEMSVRRLTYNICKELLDDDHPATKMASSDPSSLYPEIRNLINIKFSNEFRLIKEFDTSNISYIG